MKNNIKSIEFDGFKLEPYDVQIEQTDELFLKFKTKVSIEEHTKLKKFIRDYRYLDENYFEVDLGSQKTETVRFGRPVFSVHGNTVKYHLVLVSREYDLFLEERNGKVYADDIQREKIIARNSAYIDALENVLIKKGILSESEILDIRKEAQKNISTKKIEMRKVEDIDRFDF